MSNACGREVTISCVRLFQVLPPRRPTGRRLHVSFEVKAIRFAQGEYVLRDTYLRTNIG